MNKLKKIITLTLIGAVSLIGGFGIAACDADSAQGDGQNTEQTGDNGHTHSYKYDYDENFHWNVCVECGDKSEEEAHTFENDACTVCGAQKTVSAYTGKSYGVNADAVEVYTITEYTEGTTEKEVLTSGSMYNAYSAAFAYPNLILMFDDETNVTVVFNYDGEEYIVTVTAEYVLEENRFVFTNCTVDKEIETTAQELIDAFNFIYDGENVAFDFYSGSMKSDGASDIVSVTTHACGAMFEITAE